MKFVFFVFLYTTIPNLKQIGSGSVDTIGWSDVEMTQ